jgi:hypothetical protein
MQEEIEQRKFIDEIDYLHVLDVLNKWKRMILIIVLIGVIFSYSYCLMNARSITGSLVQLNFSGIENHEYPDGKKFESNDLIAPDILISITKTIKDPELMIQFSNNPRGYLYVDPNIPVEVEEQAREMKKVQKKTMFYLPNQYYIRFAQSIWGPFPSDVRKQLLYADINTFQNNFLNAYVKRPLLALDLPESILSQNDYIDAFQILNDRTNTYIGFLNTMVSTAGYYRSPRTGKTFIDIQTSMINLKSNELPGVESIIYYSSLSKQKDFLLAKTQFKIKQMEKQRQKKAMETAMANDLLKQVLEKDKRSTSQTLPSAGPNSQIVLDASALEKMNEKEYISMLVRRTLDAGVEAENLSVDKKYLEEYMSLAEKNSGNESESQVARQLVDSKLESIRKELLQLGKDTNELNQEYRESKYSNVIQTLIEPNTYTVYKIKPKVAVGVTFIVCLFISIMLAFTLDTKKIKHTIERK